MLSSNYELVKNWLVSSDIIVSESKNPNYGGVRSFYDEKKEQFAFMYPEITGYFSSTMRFLFEHEQNKKFVEFSEISCNWLIRLYENYGGIIQGITTDGIPVKLVYSFDTGVCVKGLLDCYRLTNNSYYLEYAKKMSQWILNETISEDGQIKALKNLETDTFETDPSIWYKQYGCLHLKLAIPLLQMYVITRDETYLTQTKKICDKICDFQLSDGSILLHIGKQTVNLHTLCYALEGLLYAYNITKNQKYLSSVQKAVEWCQKRIKNDGSIDLWFNSKYHSKSSYPIAQLIRIKLLLSKLENQDMESIIFQLKSFLVSLQAKNNNKKINGGFYEEFSKTVFGWKKTLRINSWSSMFALQALYWIDNYKNLEFSKEIELLY